MEEQNDKEAMLSAQALQVGKITKDNWLTQKNNEYDKEAINLANGPYEENAKKIYQKSREQKELVAVKAQKEISRRAFLKGTLVALGSMAALAAGLTAKKKVTASLEDAQRQDQIEQEQKELINNSYQKIEDSLLRQLDTDKNLGTFKQYLGENELGSYTDYLLYRLINDNKLDNYGNSNVDADECLNEKNTIKSKVYRDYEENPNKYQGIHFPDDLAIHVPSEAINRYFEVMMNAEKFSQDVLKYEEKLNENKGVSR